MASAAQSNLPSTNPQASSQPGLGAPGPQLGPTQLVDLWQRALATLDEECKASLNFNTSTKRNILEKTLKAAEEKKKLCLRRR